MNKAVMTHEEVTAQEYDAILIASFFPESLNGLEEIFVFDSLDVDFEESIY